MEFNKLKAGIKGAEVDVTRMDDDNYFEVVVKKACLDEVVKILEGVFGKPAWPSLTNLSKEAKGAIKKIGGLRSGQTLYFLNKNGRSIFAMLWPWQDGERVTIKIARI